MQYKVPQNVDIEDRVIGPLSLRQFMIVLIGIAIIVFFNFVFIGYLRILFWLFSALVAALTGTLAFAKYGDQNAEVFLAGAIKTLKNPRQRIWKKEGLHEAEAPAKTEAITKGTTKTKSLNEVRDDLNRLAQFVDTGGTLGVTEKDRLFSFDEQKQEDKITPDLLQEAESDSTAVAQIIDKTKVQRKEPLISEVASLPANQEFDYNKIETKSKK